MMVMELQAGLTMEMIRGHKGQFTILGFEISMMGLFGLSQFARRSLKLTHVTRAHPMR
jgi:hypothetical protein